MRISYWSSDVCSSDLFGIHFSLRAQGSRIGGLSPPAALVEAAGITGGPLLLCAVTSALAFFSFFPTAYRGLSELGLIPGARMVLSLFLHPIGHASCRDRVVTYVSHSVINPQYK